jgi:predicted enzyme related to lactoylglutathione lyase
LISVYVDDADRAKRFYTEVLGFETRWDAPMDDGSRWLMVGPPGGQTSLALHGPDSRAWTDGSVGGFTGSVFEVDDVFATFADWKAAGVVFVDAPQMLDFGGWARFEDSEGNVFGLHSPVTAELARS